MNDARPSEFTDGFELGRLDPARYSFSPVPVNRPRPRFVVESVRGFAPVEGRVS
jgi:hypothetical protein